MGFVPLNIDTHCARNSLSSVCFYLFNFQHINNSSDTKFLPEKQTDTRSEMVTRTWVLYHVVSGPESFLGKFFFTTVLIEIFYYKKNI